jgi:putative ABC transport system permease protein
VAPQVSAAATAVYGGADWKTTVTGSNQDWLVATGRSVALGRGLYEGEVRAGAAVCILGETVRKALFAAQDPIGQDVRVGKASCEVIGVLTAKGANTFGIDQDDLIWMPTQAVQRRLLGSTDVSAILVSAPNEAAMPAMAAELDVILRQRRHVASDDAVDFAIRDTREIASMITGILSLLSGFLTLIASVSLLVGGIGIMNIMLVSVTERTREIGIRLSIGALSRDVLMQFLVEAGVL